MALARKDPSTSTDSWGDSATTSSRVWTSKPSNAAVRDDWDDDDNDDDDAREQDGPQRLWEEANTRAPMPHVVMASSSTSAAAALSPPPAALQPVLRILKRPSASTTASPSTLQSAPTSGSYAEREAAYHAARERIFGEAASPSGPSPGSGGITPEGTRARSPTSALSGVRGGQAVTTGERLSGGREQGGDGEKGFANRRGKRRGGGRP
ncbi:hypothetical protein BC628DRAFT_1364590 [Trametes gibbosa]|nr:hypothetical protein BC628DRAFT_1364590 [Trametes gibbosa]